MDIDEARTILGEYSGDPEETSPRTLLFMSYDDSNDYADREDTDIYGHTVIARAKQAGVIWTACDEIAASVGAGDEDEAHWALLAIASQWQRTATQMGIPTAEGVRLAVLAEELRYEIHRLGDRLFECLPDLVKLSQCHWGLENLAAGWRMEHGNDAQVKFLNDHLADIRTTFGLMAILKADLRSRGELDLADELLFDDE